MKDKRLDVLLRHYLQENECAYLIKDQGSEFCEVIMINEFPKEVSCHGQIADCEVEE